jgi:hypothetical protein
MVANEVIDATHIYTIYKGQNLKVKYPVYTQYPACDLTVQMTLKVKTPTTEYAESSAKWLGNNPVKRYFEIDTRRELPETHESKFAGSYLIRMTATLDHI